MSRFFEPTWPTTAHNCESSVSAHHHRVLDQEKLSDVGGSRDILWRLAERDNLSNFVWTVRVKKQFVKSRNCFKRRAQARKSFRKNHTHVNVQRFDMICQGKEETCIRNAMVVAQYVGQYTLASSFFVWTKTRTMLTSKQSWQTRRILTCCCRTILSSLKQGKKTRPFETQWKSHNLFEHCPFERSSFCGSRQEQCWHRSGVNKPEESWFVVAACLLEEYAITKHLVVVCAEASRQRWSESGERKPNHSWQSREYNEISTFSEQCF